MDAVLRIRMVFGALVGLLGLLFLILVTAMATAASATATASSFFGCDTKLLYTVLPSAFGSTLAACSFLVFTLLYTPCVAAVAALRREFKSRFTTLGIICFQCTIAWLTACLVFQIGGLFL